MNNLLYQHPSSSSLLAIIPAYNEQETIQAVVRSLQNAVPEIFILVIDDGSHDETAIRAKRSGATVISLPFNLGIGGALQTGFRYATRNGFQRAFQFDADGQHNTEDIQTLVAGLEAGNDLVIGNRFSSSESYRIGVFRGLAMRLLRTTVRLVIKQSLTDTTSGFRAFSRPMLEFFAENYPQEYMESVEALFIAHKNGFSIQEVSCKMNERIAGIPSNRNVKLLYHYFRLLFVLGISLPQRNKQKKNRNS